MLDLLAVIAAGIVVGALVGALAVDFVKSLLERRRKPEYSPAPTGASLERFIADARCGRRVTREPRRGGCRS